MYFADTYRHVIFVFDYDLDTGTIGNRRMFSDMRGWTGRPDGSQVDADGCLWNAEYAGSRVVRYTPEGRIDRVINLPVSQPTSCTFGGRNLDELYITTASQRLSPEQLAAEPLAGALFVVRPGICGLSEGRYRS
jgi:sugar lactone lactonase YvrE